MKTSIVKLPINESLHVSYCLKCFMIISIVLCAFIIAPKVMTDHGKSTAFNLLQDTGMV